MNGRTTDEAAEISGYTRPAPHPVLAELRRIRVEGGVTQAAVAALLLTNKRAISRWETGARIPNVDQVAELAAVLGYELALRPKVYVLDGPPDVSPVEAAAHRAVLAQWTDGIDDDYEPTGGAA